MVDSHPVKGVGVTLFFILKNYIMSEIDYTEEELLKMEEELREECLETYLSGNY